MNGRAADARRDRNVLVDVVRVGARRQADGGNLQRVGVAVDVAVRNPRLPRFGFERQSLRHADSATRRDRRIRRSRIDTVRRVMNRRAGRRRIDNDVQRACVGASRVVKRRRADLPRVGCFAHLDRQEAAHGRAVADLCGAVLSPRPDSSVGCDGYTVSISARDLGNIRDGRDRDSRGLRRSGAVAELAVVVVAPRPDRIVLRDNQRVIGAGGDSGDRRNVHNRDWC